MKFVLSDESITVVYQGKVHSVQRGAINFNLLRHALQHKDWTQAVACLNQLELMHAWSRGRFAICGGRFYFDGRPVPPEFNKRLFDTAAEGADPAPLLTFYERLSRNPSKRSVEQLFKFLEHLGIPIVCDGSFLAYKGVSSDYRDIHSNTFDNRPGQSHEMDRAAVADDPTVGCHVGFHVGSEAYAKNFGSRVVICQVAPEDVVCIPNDCEYQKMRVCRYTVIGHYGETLPSTTCEVQPSTDEERFQRYMAMSTAQLIKLPVEELRDFINNGLRVIGKTKANSSVELAELIARQRVS